MNIEKIVIIKFATFLKVEEDKITKESLLKEDLNLDSLDLVELVIEFEEEFNIEIENEDVESIKSINDIIVFIENKEK